MEGERKGGTMRSIQINTDVFAAIWAARIDGEETEDQILRRLLECGGQGAEGQVKPAEINHSSSSFGFFDARNGVEFYEGFKIFRRYKGDEFSATATQGSWVREDNGKSYPSLNQLNQSIVEGQENVWNGNWFYRLNGREVSIASLRS